MACAMYFFTMRSGYTQFGGDSRVGHAVQLRHEESAAHLVGSCASMASIRSRVSTISAWDSGDGATGSGCSANASR